MMRAKMEVENVLVTGYGETVQMKPVCSASFGPEGESEDNTFARYTPAGGLHLTITNPELLGKIRPGMKFYVDFTEA